MSKQEKDEDTGEMLEFSLQDLLKAQQEVRANVNAEQDEIARQAAIKRFGLVERGEGGKPSKKEVAELEELRKKVADLESQVLALSTENADLKSRLTPPPAPVPPVAPTVPPADPANPFATA